jgi:hypothetical protein
LFRKLAQGQFCNKAHQEAYWKEQDQLAVEVLHRTHDALQAYKTAEPIESILGPTAAPPVVRGPEPALEVIPELQSLQRQIGMDRPIAPPASAMIAADPVEYELRPVAAAPTRVLQNQPVRSFDRMAGLIPLSLGSALVPAPMPLPVALPAADPQMVLSSPAWTHFGTRGLGLGGLVALNEGLPLGPSSHQQDAHAVEFSISPVRVLVHTLAPCGNMLEQMEQEAFPLGETMLALAAPLAAALAASVVGGSGFEAFPVEAVALPRATEATATPLSLTQTADLLDLPAEITARNWTPVVESNPTSIESRVPAIAMEHVRMASVASSDSMTDLLAHSGCAALAPLGMGQPRGTIENPLNRPVSYQAFVPECSTRLPDSARRHVSAPALEIRAHAKQLFRLNLAEKMQPRAELRLRPGFVAAPVQGEALLPKSKLQPMRWILPGSVPTLDGAILNQESSARRMASGVANFWNNAPRDLRMLLFAVPLALGLAFHPSLPKVSWQAPGSDGQAVTAQLKNVVDTQVASLRKSMSERAAVGLDENFRQGLDNWMSHSGSTAEWSFDQAGFVQPGRVALYQPSLGLTDYEFQFLGAIDKGALSWVARATDFENYYVVKLVTVRSGPVPEMGITRYAVINGKAVDRVDTPVTFQSRTDSLYRVSMVMEGSRYSLVIQGQMIDSWNEPRLKRGGVGFFTNRGEQSRIGWVQITHQYDMLGRLFAYLAP